MLHESAAFSGVLSHSCPPRRATRSVVLSHKISTPPACWPGESKFSSGQLSTQSSAKNTVESRNARCWCASCPRAAQKKNRLEVRGPLVPYPTPEPAAFAPSKTALVPFLSPFRLFLCFVPIEYKAKQKCIASMILGALAAMAQTKVKRLLAHSSIGHVGYIRTGFSCGTIEGIQSLLIGIFIYALMTIDAFAIVLALRQTRVKYIADLGALAKTNPISAITFSITMFSYAGIPPLAGFCSKFYLFFAALGCGAYFLAPVGVVTSVIGRWAAGRLPRVSQFGGPKAVLRAPDT
ncbi:hypothetical protein WN944_023860 [Citrus x changshan-huyou]|uniref:NADH:quinone oxidoreductase/Mrp antiporter transmembrane domain-containing protein n=1 Tax=Citrus x changshan-huyou TaxID=2935761 RepID=A0AAP0QC12_9ROSI